MTLNEVELIQIDGFNEIVSLQLTGKYIKTYISKKLWPPKTNIEKGGANI